MIKPWLMMRHEKYLMFLVCLVGKILILGVSLLVKMLQET